MEEFIYPGSTITNQNSIQVEIMNTFKPGNASYHSVQNLSFSSMLSKSLKTKKYRTTILPVVFMGVKFGLSH